MQPYRLYGMGSPNVVKVVIALEELGLPYAFEHVDVILGAQRTDWFRALTPNNKVPVLVEPREDGEDLALFESGAIMDYLAERHGGFIGGTLDEKAATRQWLTFQMANVGPAFGQAIHFTFSTSECPYGGNRFTIEMRRLLAVIEMRLSEAEFLAGAYSIADMALWPWIGTLGLFFPDDIKGAALQRWHAEIAGRAAVERAQATMATIARADRQSMKTASKEQLDRYFGRVPA